MFIMYPVISNTTTISFCQETSDTSQELPPPLPPKNLNNNGAPFVSPRRNKNTKNVKYEVCG